MAYATSDIGKITVKYVLERAQKLKTDFSTRDERCAEYEKMYLLDVWKQKPEPNQVRVTLPTAHDTIEKMRALLMTRPPVVSVPPTSPDPEDEGRAQKIETYLYGVIARTNFHRALYDAEWYAMTFGSGIIRTIIDPYSPEGDFPIVVTSPDPRTVYWIQDTGRGRVTEVAHQWKRSRREIETEWPFKFERPMTFATLQAEADWLDQTVNYIEYWCETYGWEEAPPELPPPPDLGIAAIEAETGMEGVGAEIAEYSKNGKDAKPTKIRVRKIVHCVVVDEKQPNAPRREGDGTGTMIKKPVIMPGYRYIPFSKWSGTSTPLNGVNADLSALFPLSNGDNLNAMGVLAALSLLASIDLEAAIKAPNAPVFTDDEKGEVDMEMGAINQISQGAKVFRLQTEVTNPAVMRSSDLLTAAVNRAALPEVLTGQVYQLSGQAISGLATAFQMVIGFKQKDRERAIEHAMENILSLTEYYVDAAGWSVWGEGPYGQYVDVVIKREDIAGNHRVQCKLSASMPRDTANMASVLSMLQSKGQLSLETLLDQLQKLPEFGLAADTPANEIVRIYRDKLLGQPEFQKIAAVGLGHQVLALLEEVGLTPQASFAMQQMLQDMLEPPKPSPQGMGGQPVPPTGVGEETGGLPAPNQQAYAPPDMGVPPIGDMGGSPQPPFVGPPQGQEA